ncbi:unnamed protein product [Cunninghamella blakesleeana]
MMMTFITCFGSRLKTSSKKKVDKQQKVTNFKYFISTPTLPITPHDHDDIITTATVATPTTTDDISLITNHFNHIQLNNQHDDDITIINQPFTISPPSSVISFTLNKLKSSILSSSSDHHHPTNKNKHKNNIPMKSNVSSSASLLLPPSKINQNQTNPLPPLLPPPCYFDDVVLKIPTNPKHPKIEPREEEGKEDLPPYECTVYKMDYMFIKHEFESPTKKAKNRTWRKVYLVIWGTTISAYKSIPSQFNNNNSKNNNIKNEDDKKNQDDDNKLNIKEEKYNDDDDNNHHHQIMKVKEIKEILPIHPPHHHHNKNNKKNKKLWCYSMQDAEAGNAHDYRKKKHVIRIRLHQGPQLLISTMSEEEQLLWIEHLQASINVSVDLDHRKMPQFITSNRRRRRRGRLYHDPNHPTPSRYREGSLI